MSLIVMRDLDGNAHIRRNKYRALTLNHPATVRVKVTQVTRRSSGHTTHIRCRALPNRSRVVGQGTPPKQKHQQLIITKIIILLLMYSLCN